MIKTMFNHFKKVYPIALSLGLVLGTSTYVHGHTARINSLSDFYDYYDPAGNIFTLDQRSMIEGIFGNIGAYFGSNGLENAISAGFIPLTQELIGHGTHWLNPNPPFTDITNLQANALLPAGLNFDKDGNLAAVFWTQELYQPLVPLIQELNNTIGLTNLDPATLTQLYAQHKQTTLQPVPTLFQIFPNTEWHYHQNVVIENLGAKNAQGKVDPNLTNFRQSLSDQSFINELLAALTTEEKVIAPLEIDLSLGYPPFNQGISPGFYMIHMWVGQGNHSGLFGGTNPDISVSANAISEAETFEDGSGGHGHPGMGGGHDHGHSQKIPEPSSILGLFILGLLLPLTKRLN